MSHEDSEIVTSDYVPAFPLYRRAVAMAAQAERRAMRFAASGGRERLFREVDATIETVVLAQAAAEGWIYAAYRHAQVRGGGHWRDHWASAPAAICGPTARALDAATIDSLNWLSAWRNYLVHDDDTARQRVETFVTQTAAHDHLRAPLAREVISRMDDAFSDVGSIIGHRTFGAPHSTFAWIAEDER